MEVTIHKPLQQWYYYSEDYWRLDYPPLSGYVSWVFGMLANRIDTSWMKLDASRGIESYESKIYMRSTVVICDLVLFYPAAILFVRQFLKNEGRVKKLTALMILLMQPALILIDHGHFQYNLVMLGFTLLTITMFHINLNVVGGFFFCLALMFKQMALYYSPAIFIYLLAKCYERGPKKGSKLFIMLGITVVATFAIHILPLVSSLNDLKQIFARIFPIARGLYEDKVANFWCAINPFFKLRSMFALQTLLRISLSTTVLAFIPTLCLLFLTRDTVSLIYGLSNCSLSFFLFAFQVHEKSILLPLLPITLLLAKATVEQLWDRKFWKWIVNFAVFSMYPLLKKDGQTIPYFCLLSLWNLLLHETSSSSAISQSRLQNILSWIMKLTYLTAIAIQTLDAVLIPPKRYPDLYVVLNVMLSAGVFGIGWAWGLYAQYIWYCDSKRKTTKNKPKTT
ncbi:glycosyl transferase [Paraphysoderma sedebokerense]|nr:glycosyl transferase [Paraphysoderma sedebokerense]